MTRTPPAAFAVPGDITTLTGGYLYDRHLLEGLRDLGHEITHLALADSFPAPSPAEMQASLSQLAAQPGGVPVIVDGLAFGALDTEGLARIEAPLVALVHHPLALESGLPPATAEHLFRTERDNLRLARHVLVPSPHTRQILIDRYDVPARAITIARPGVTAPRIAAAPPSDQPPLILSVGILHPRKGHDILIAALAMLADLDWCAVIAGNPWDHAHAAELARMLADSPVVARVELAGLVPDARLQALYAEASLFALATRYEGHGLVFDEALLRGLPIISCRTGAVPDTVPSAAGLLVPTDDATAFAGALRRLLSDSPLRDGCAAVARREGALLPDWPATARTVSDVLARLAG